MKNKEEKLQPIFSHVEPVFAVKDVIETISYWQNVLGFPNIWTWDEPPTFGAVSWQKVHVQFYKDEALAEASKGNSVWIRLQHIEALYKFHQEKYAEIIAPLEKKPWGMSQYTLRDINGYFICFPHSIGIDLSLYRNKSFGGLVYYINHLRSMNSINVSTSSTATTADDSLVRSLCISNDKLEKLYLSSNATLTAAIFPILAQWVH